METIVFSEKAIARLQTAQAAYNLTVQVEVEGERISLCEAVKRLGGYERRERMWRNAMRQVVPGAARARHRYVMPGAQSAEEQARPTVTQAQARELTSAASKSAAKLRSAIAAGNALELEIKDLELALFS
jgi:hypothetical protein